jgi:5-methylcytosine-specific restriction enzyme subunit McrC
MNEYQLHEHTSSPFRGDSESLSMLLQKIWDNRERQPHYLDDEIDKEDIQQLLSIIYNSKGEATIKAKHYVGMIKTLGKEPTTINILPKIYKDQNISDDKFNKDLLLWLKYSKKIRLPKYKSGANRINNDLLEVFIYMFASYTKKLFATNLYQNYTDISRDLSVVRGRINMPRYIRNISQGNMHRISCDYQRYQLDNNFNRIVKYVAKLLIKISNDKTTKRYLRDIIFLLDEVKDKAVRSSDCDKVRFNQIFSDHQTVLDYCRLFLNNSVSYGAPVASKYLLCSLI